METTKANKKGNVFDRISKYASIVCKRNGGEITVSQRSLYMRVNGRCLRISNHVANGSDGIVAIIADPNSDALIMHIPSNGKLSVITERQAREFIRSFIFMSNVMKEIIIQQETDLDTVDEHMVLGYPESFFTD